MDVRLAKPADVVAWDTYVDEHPRGTPYHLSGWAEILEDSFGYRNLSLIAREGDRVRGVLPLLAVRSRLTRSRLVSTPLASYGGPLADDPGVERRLVDRGKNLTRAQRGEYLELRYPHGEGTPPGGVGLQQKDLYRGFRETLPDDPDEVISFVPRKCRRMVRLGIKAGLEGRALAWSGSAHGDDAGDARHWLDEAHDLVATTMRNLGTPTYSRGFLRDLLAHDPDRWFLWGAFDGDRMAAAVFTARLGGALYPTISGGDREYRSEGVNNFLYATLMQHGIAHGDRTFDFGRSKAGTGACRFKRYFGFEPRPLRYSYYMPSRTTLPDLSPNNPRYALAIEAWRRLPVSLTKLVGPHLVGHFG